MLAREPLDAEWAERANPTFDNLVRSVNGPVSLEAALAYAFDGSDHPDAVMKPVGKVKSLASYKRITDPHRYLLGVPFPRSRRAPLLYHSPEGLLVVSKALRGWLDRLHEVAELADEKGFADHQLAEHIRRVSDAAAWATGLIMVASASGVIGSVSPTLRRELWAQSAKIYHELLDADREAVATLRRLSPRCVNKGNRTSDGLATGMV